MPRDRRYLDGEYEPDLPFERYNYMGTPALPRTFGITMRVEL
jgi:hypothetical protein